MVKDINIANESVKPNHKEMEILHTHFPQCFNAEGNFDIDKFQDLIKDSVGIAHEGYDLNFLGKSYAKLLASIDTTTVIVPDTEHNNKPENVDSKNIYISGDNLDGLKHLLKSYSGKVKCIYIDPPYNTGSDGFVYNDNFNFTIEDLQTKLSVGEEQAKKILDLTKRGSASHSAWLMFMASRLQLAKDLLTKDGVIFISIDNNECANLKLLCDSIFGEENFIEMFSWVKTATPPSLSTKSRKTNEYVLCYERERNGYKYLGDLLDGGDQPLLNSGNVKRILTIPKDKLYFSSPKMRGVVEPYTSERVELMNKININEAGYADVDVILKGEFKWTEEFLAQEIEKGTTFIIKSDKLSIRFLRDEEGYKRPTNFIRESILCPTINKPDNNVETNEQSSRDLESLMDDSIFSFPKPISLIRYLFNFIAQPNDIIVDFFSGSATTGHAVMASNASDEDNALQYILIQLPENLDNNYASASADDKKKIRKVINFLDRIGKPHYLDEIGIERLKRAAAKIKTDTNADIDYGFKHYTLAEPSDDVLSKLDSFDPTVMFDDNTILSEFGEDTVLETWQVHDGYGFGAKSSKVKLDEYTAYHMDKHLYLIGSGFTDKDMVALVDKYHSDSAFNPENIVLFGYSFTYTQTEMLKSNLATLKESVKSLKINLDIRY